MRLQIESFGKREHTHTHTQHSNVVESVWFNNMKTKVKENIVE